MTASTFKDPINSIFVYTHNSACGTDTVTFGQTSNYSFSVFFIQMKTEEHCIATFRESALTGSTAKQFGFVFTIGVIADYVALSLLSVVFAFLVGTATLRYIRGYSSDYVRLF